MKIIRDDKLDETNRIYKSIAVPLIILLIYIVYFCVATRFIIRFNMLISIEDITINNLMIKFIGDFLLMLLIPFILVVTYKNRLAEFRLEFQHHQIQPILIGIILVLFLLHGDFTIRGYYKLFFYVVVVGFGEEFIFRGYVYNSLTKYNKLLAVVVSGLFWGILHAILPGFMAGDGLGQMVTRMLSEIGGGIVVGYYFIYILEKSKSLFVPMFIHAIIDYSVGGIGIITAICTGVYFRIVDRKKL